ncbi:MAG: ABC transporter ATP-binding protein [Planctomycetota bacterium]
MRAFWWALKYALRHRSKFIISVVLSFVAAALRAGSFGALIPFLSVLLEGKLPAFVEKLPEKVPAWLAPAASDFVTAIRELPPVEMLAAVAVLLLVVVALRGIVVVIQEVLTARITFDATRRLAFDIYAAVLATPIIIDMGGLLARFSADLEDVRVAVRRVTGRFFLEPLNALGIVGTLLLINSKLALLSMLVFPVAASVTVLAARAVKRGARRVLKHRTSLMAIVEEGLRGLTTIRVFGLEDRELERFEQQNQGLARRLVKLALIEALHRPVLEIVGSLAVVACLLLGFGYVQQEEMTPSELIAFYTALVSLVDPLRKLSNTNVIMQRASAGSERLLETYRQATSTMMPSGTRCLSRPVRELELAHVNAQLGGEVVLRDVSVCVRRGEILVIAGLSGSGKTTLLSLLPRLIDPIAGEVRIDGYALPSFDIDELRSGLGFVGQDLFLFNASIRDNLLVARPEATPEEVIEAARQAQAHEFIAELPDGYDTLLGERGLSAGQRQRLTIARALLRRPEILILDEPTSALDRFHETHLLQEFQALSSERITLLVTHRLDAVPDDARILVLDRGEVVTCGKKAELTAADPRFRLMATQFVSRETGASVEEEPA